MYNQTRSDLSPYRDLGGYSGGELRNRLTELTAPIIMGQAELEATPGYQFTLNQGLKAAQNSAAARGLGLSGAAIKAATGYASGLADQTYLNQFNVANTNRTNAFNRLFQTTQLGQGAATGQATANLLTGNQIAQNTIGAGNAQGAAAIAGGNAVGSALQYGGGYINRLLQAGGGGSGGYFGNDNGLTAAGWRPDQWV
ncbi:MAG TPA: hypothetical protein VGU70_09360 [Methylobacterium sp.]|nr:hypothetical protein [Methylobacterium sp.]